MEQNNANMKDVLLHLYSRKMLDRIRKPQSLVPSETMATVLEKACLETGHLWCSPMGFAPAPTQKRYAFELICNFMCLLTHWCQLEDMFQSIVMPRGIEKVTIQLLDTPTKVYAIGARLLLSKVPLEVLQNWELLQLIVTPNVLGKVQGQIKEMCGLIEPCLLIGTREYING